MIPFMVGGLVFVPKTISFLAIIGLVIAGLTELRKGASWLSRPSIIANSFLLWQIFFPIWANLPQIFQLYLDIGTIAAIVAIFTYFSHKQLPSLFYNIAFLLYGSFSVLAIIFISIKYGLKIL